MPNTTFEEAKKCPKCGNYGEDRYSEAAPKAANLRPGTRIHHIYCMTDGCRWYGTPWQVQVNPDGSVPPPRDHRREPKIYHGFEGHDEQAKALVDALKRQAERETHGGYEIRNV